MRSTYSETQYLTPAAYGLLSGCGIALVLVAGIAALPTLVAAFLAAVGGLLLGAIVLLGCMTIRVECGRLTVRFGWLGLRWSTAVAAVERARICGLGGLDSFHGWNWRWALDGSRCFGRGRGRAVEVFSGGRRTLIATIHPQELKESIVGPSDPGDDQPEYLKERIELPSRRRTAVRQDWALITRKHLAVSA